MDIRCDMRQLIRVLLTQLALVLSTLPLFSIKRLFHLSQLSHLPFQVFGVGGKKVILLN